MSETIDYYGRVTGFRKDEKEEIQNVCSEFQDAMFDSITDEEIAFRVDSEKFGVASNDQIIRYMMERGISQKEAKKELKDWWNIKKVLK